MAKPVDPPTPKTLTREERLAAKLRENLHRRKAQARALGAVESDAFENDSPALPNPRDES